MNKKLEKLEAAAVGTQISCGLCGGPHENHYCSLFQDDRSSIAQVNYVGNQPRPPYNDPHSNTNNPGWRNPPQFQLGRQSRAARAMEQPQFSKTTTIPFTSTSPKSTESS
ncbi:hypothetical protein PIB30_082953 [Stylosanthes scabra]|uniref:Uncharacterized protein n=1 Tax=Stylosanthes scabra TaxID=79078 RepID=A0ABU6WS24_9FABA|nr:hypothetical protein [Stylosanthes scabra]